VPTVAAIDAEATEGEWAGRHRGPTTHDLLCVGRDLSRRLVGTEPRRQPSWM